MGRKARGTKAGKKRRSSDAIVLIITAIKERTSPLVEKAARYSIPSSTKRFLCHKAKSYMAR